jgi:mono/diheme cytochrome c family protein
MRGIVGFVFLIASVAAVAKPETHAEELLVRKCKSCHVLEQQADAPGQLLYDGPPLIYAGTKFRHEWLVAWLQRPTRIRPAGYLSFRYVVAGAQGDRIDTSRLPQHPAVSGEEARAIADWFESRRRELPSPAGVATQPVSGNLHFQKILGCAGCHRIAHQGGLSGPELGTASTRLNPGWLRAFVEDTSAWSPTVMPRIAMRSAQLEAVVEFVEQLNEPMDWPTAAVLHSSQASARDAGSLTRQALLYQVYCSQCHGILGNGRGINAPYLFVAPRDHTSAAEMKLLTQEDVFTAIKLGGRAVGKSSLMPSWSGTIPDADIWLLAEYVRGLSRERHDAAP